MAMNPTTQEGPLEGPLADARDSWNKFRNAISDSIEYLGAGIAAHDQDLNHLHKLIADLQFRMDHLEENKHEARMNWLDYKSVVDWLAMCRGNPHAMFDFQLAYAKDSFIRALAAEAAKPSHDYAEANYNQAAKWANNQEVARLLAQEIDKP